MASRSNVPPRPVTPAVLAEPAEELASIDLPGSQVGSDSDPDSAKKVDGPKRLVRDPVINTLDDAEDADASGQWRVVDRSKPKRRITSVRCTAGPNVTTLLAVEHRKHIHLWNMVSGVEDIRAYMQTLCPNGTCTVDELKPKGEYKSYKIGVPAKFIDKCLSPEVWPENARVKMWFFRGRSGSEQQNPAKGATQIK